MTFQVPVGEQTLKEVVFVFSGTAAVALAGLLGAQRALGKPITEHRVLFLGAGEVKKNNPVLTEK